MKANQWAKWLLVLLLAVASAWVLSACSGDDDDDATPAAGAAGADGADGADGAAGAPGADGADAATPSNVDVAGVWNGTRSSDAGSTQIQFYFEQNGGVLSGEYHDTSGYAGNVAGTINGDDIQLAIVLTAGSPGATWTFTGAANAAGTQLQGHMNTGSASDDISATK